MMATSPTSTLPAIILITSFPGMKSLSRGKISTMAIGEEGIYLPLALAYPPSSYRSKAVIELAKVIHEVLEE